MEHNIKMEFIPVGSKYRLCCYINNILQNNSIVLELLKLDKRMLQQILINKNSNTIIDYNYDSIWVEDEDDCDGIINLININIGNIRHSNEYYFYIQEAITFEESTIFCENELESKYKFYITLAIQDKCIIQNDKDISNIIGLSLDEYHNYLTNNNIDHMIIDGELYFQTNDDCKKAIDFLADNFEQLLLVKKILNK